MPFSELHAHRRRDRMLVAQKLSQHACAQIIEGLAGRYEAHHRVSYTPEALAAAVSLTARYVADRQLPDKAIDVIDEAGSRARITAYHARRAVDDGPALKLQELAQVRASDVRDSVCVRSA